MKKTEPFNRAGGDRQYFVDNLRIVLTVLVVIHHIAMVYGSSAPFYYREQPTSTGAYTGFLIFVLFNQSFFMGLFFFLSGYLVPQSFDKKGAGKYFLGRLLRLGIPLVAFIFIFSPIANIGLWNMPENVVGPLGPLTWNLYPKLIGVGPLWFVEMLLLFDVGYTMIRLIRNRKSKTTVKESENSTGGRLDAAQAKPVRRFPAFLGIIIFVLILAGATFFLRMAVPMGYTVPFLGFPTFAYFPQYFSFFVIGIIASRRAWLQKMPRSFGIAGIAMAVFASVFFFPPAISGKLFSLKLSVITSRFVGNGSWQSALYTAWDSIFSVGLCLALITLFKDVFNRQKTFLTGMSKQCYMVYIIHIPIVVFTAIAIREIAIPSVPKFFIAMVIIVPLCFALSWLLKKIPGVARIV
jgi:hypothetical protein